MEHLFEFCTTDRQRDMLQAYITYGSHRKAGKVLGLPPQNMSRLIIMLKKRAGESTGAPRDAVPGFTSNLDESGGHGVLTLREHRVVTAQDAFDRSGLDPDVWEIERAVANAWDQKPGEQLHQIKVWVRRKADTLQAMESTIRALTAGLPPRPKVPAPRPAAPKDLLNLLPITDVHLGLRAWGHETGVDWDLRTAETALYAGFIELLSRMPPADEACIVFLGDFLHFDSLDALTPASKNPLDADSRYPKIVETAIELALWLVEETLARHRKVRVLVLEGNHDPAGTVWLRAVLQQTLARNPRAAVSDQVFPYDAFLHGETFLGFHHGHKTRLKGLARLFSSEPRFRPLWGAATRSYLWMGDIHHTTVLEEGGAVAESLQTLCPKDAWHARAGYVAGRSLSGITYSKTKGEVGRARVSP